LIPFETNYISENLVAPGIVPGPLDLQPGTLTARQQRWSNVLVQFEKMHYHGDVVRLLAADICHNIVNYATQLNLMFSKV
jgi:hypothetical protein